MLKKYVAGIEIGGTSAAVAITDTIGKFLWKKKGITTGKGKHPIDAIKDITNALKSAPYKISSIGIASFGPLDIKKGCIGKTPKPNWEGFPLVASIKKEFKDIPITLETDVNAPAYSEYTEFVKEDPTISSLAYITVGTGVGLGLYADGKMYHGSMHPEFGHTFIRKATGDNFEGTCPFHKDMCIEGLVASGAIAKRLGIDQYDIRYIKNDNKFWDMYTNYMAQATANAALSYSIDAMVIGGGITTAPGRDFLYKKIENEARRLINGYVKTPRVLKPHFGQDAGLVGATAVALKSFN